MGCREPQFVFETHGDECLRMPEVWPKKRLGLRAQPAELPSSLGSRGRFDKQTASIQVLDNVSEKDNDSR